MLRLIFIVFLIIVVAVCTVMFTPDLIKLLRDGDMEEMREYITGAGNEGILVIVGLQFLQTITIFFPGIPIYMCSGIVYGKIKGTLICYLTYVVSNVVIYFISKRMKESAAVIYENQDSGRIEKLMGKTKRPALLIALLCVVPIIPNGIIPHLAANANLTLKQFMKAVAFGCIPGIFLFVWCGELLLTEYFWIVVAMMVLAVVLLVFGMRYKNYFVDRIETFLEKKFNSKQS
ncbi:MAG: VTT domain-containing protein [Lachnospiraceae bacterium]|nr:VTT domain-containing protein [Lachnospiraceae bacterium]